MFWVPFPAALFGLSEGARLARALRAGATVHLSARSIVKWYVRHLRLASWRGSSTMERVIHVLKACGTRFRFLNK